MNEAWSGSGETPQPDPRSTDGNSSILAGVRRNLAGLVSVDGSRLGHVDGLRAFAILLVMGSHLVNFLALKKIVGEQSTFRQLSWFRGEYGVDVFFAISGFLIGSIVFGGIDVGKFSLWKFYKRRFLRLAPAYYLTLVILLSLEARPLLTNDRGNCLYNFLYLNNFAPLFDQFMGWSWSLAIEEQFYWVFPLLALMAHRTRASAIPWLLGSWIIAAVAWMFFLLHRYDIPIFGTSDQDILEYGDRVYATTMYRSAGIVCGLLAAWARVFRPQSQISRSRVEKAMLLLTVIVFFAPEIVLGHSTTVVYLGLTHLGVSACAAVVVFGLLHQDVPFLSRVLRARSLALVAKLSYSLYLLHPVVNSLLGDAFAERGFAPSGPNIALLMLASVLVSFCCATLMYVLVEKPIMDLRER